jgi:DNA-binding winged helix-turn-helix (wHTH) protein
MHYQFAAFSFDPQRGLQGPSGRIGLRRCDADLLCMLLEADGRIVTKEAILNHVWRGRLVTEHSISQAVRRLRAAFGPDGESVIQTVYGSGYRLGMAALRQETVADARRPAFAASPSLEATTSLAAAWELAATIEAAQFALERDPGFVAAWCGLATFHAARAARMVVPPREAGEAAVNAANRPSRRPPRAPRDPQHSRCPEDSGRRAGQSEIEHDVGGEYPAIAADDEGHARVPRR